jgi:hypothetical protein
LNTVLLNDGAVRNWFVVYQDGAFASDAEVEWASIAQWEDFGERKFSMLKRPAESLSAIVGKTVHTLRAPDRETTRFFREYRARGNLMTGETEVYHMIGYMWSGGRVTLEIDPNGNTQIRVN